MAVLIAGANLKKESSWPLGHVVLLPGQDAPQLCWTDHVEQPIAQNAPEADLRNVPIDIISVNSSEVDSESSGVDDSSGEADVLLFASASDFSLSPVADFKSTKSVNTAKQNVVLGLKKGYTILLHFRVGSIQYHAVLYLIKSTPGRKGGQDQHKLWKHVVPSHLEFAWLPHDLAHTFCANALDKDPRRLYAMPDSAIDSNVQAAWVTVDQIYWIGECKSAHELDVFVNMPIERLRVGCGLQCTLPLHPLGPSSRPKLFAAAVNLLKFAPLLRMPLRRPLDRYSGKMMCMCWPPFPPLCLPS